MDDEEKFCHRHFILELEEISDKAMSLFHLINQNSAKTMYLHV